MDKTRRKMSRKEEKKKRTPVARPIQQEKIISFYIPGEIVSDILLRLPARSLAKYRCVCKSWLSITSNTSFLQANAQRNRTTRPSLFFHDLKRLSKIYLASADSNSASGICLRDYKPAKSISQCMLALASCDGLVCAMKFTAIDSHYCVVNPLTGHRITLPMEGVIFNSTVGFYFHRSTSKYRLIRITADVSDVLVVGESSWRRIPSIVPTSVHYPYPVDLNGNVYWLSHLRNVRRFDDPPDTVLIFDAEQEVYSEISLPPLGKLHGHRGSLNDFNGELGLWIIRVGRTIDVWILKNCWIKRYSVNFAHICEYPSILTLRGTQSGAIIVGDEEIMLRLSRHGAPKYEAQDCVLRCNLKSGACGVLNVRSRPDVCHFTLPYAETLINPQCY